MLFAKPGAFPESTGDVMREENHSNTSAKGVPAPRCVQALRLLSSTLHPFFKQPTCMRHVLLIGCVLILSCIHHIRVITLIWEWWDPAYAGKIRELEHNQLARNEFLKICTTWRYWSEMSALPENHTRSGYQIIVMGLSIPLTCFERKKCHLKVTWGPCRFMMPDLVCGHKFSGLLTCLTCVCAC